MASIHSHFSSSESPPMSSSSFLTPIAASSTLKRGLSQQLEPPLFKRKRDHSYFSPLVAVPDASNHHGRPSYKSRLPLLDISDLNEAMPLPAQDGDDIPKISLRPRTMSSFESRDEMAQQLFQFAPRPRAAFVPAWPAPMQEEEERSQEEAAVLSEPVVELTTNNQMTRRSSFSSIMNGTPMMRRSLSFRLSIGSCNSAHTTGGQGSSNTATPANGVDGRFPLSKSLERLSIPSLEDDENLLLPRDDENVKPRQPVVLAQPPQAKRGSRVVFDYLTTALRLPDAAFGV